MNTSQEKGAGSTIKVILIVIFMGAILAGGLWIWISKSNEIKGLKRENAKERAELIKEAKEHNIKSQINYLKALAKPISWAFRTEMIQGNTKNVKQYSNELVKESGFKIILVAGKKGTILASTNKKYEGAHFSTFAPVEHLLSNETEVQRLNDSTLIMTSPITGYNNRLGTIYIKYQISSGR